MSAPSPLQSHAPEFVSAIDAEFDGLERRQEAYRAEYEALHKSTLESLNQAIKERDAARKETTEVREEMGARIDKVEKKWMIAAFFIGVGCFIAGAVVNGLANRSKDDENEKS